MGPVSLSSFNYMGRFAHTNCTCHGLPAAVTDKLGRTPESGPASCPFGRLGTGPFRATAPWRGSLAVYLNTPGASGTTTGSGDPVWYKGQQCNGRSTSGAEIMPILPDAAFYA